MTSVERVQSAIELAEAGVSGLTPKILALPGMSSAKVRRFLNNLMPNRYLEVGVWKGSTFVSACSGNWPEVAVAVDNFTQFQEDDNGEARFREVVEQFLVCPYKLHNRSFFDMSCAELPDDIDVYFYDGDHGPEWQRKAMTHIWPNLCDRAIVVVDDSQSPGVVEATQRGISEAGGCVERYWNMPARFNGDEEQWWNGLFVAVIRKTR